MFLVVYKVIGISISRCSISVLDKVQRRVVGWPVKWSGTRAVRLHNALPVVPMFYYLNKPRMCIKHVFILI